MIFRFLKNNKKQLKKQIHCVKIHLSIKSVRGTSLLTTQQPTKRKGANA